jgi:hypothetical protein
MSTVCDAAKNRFDLNVDESHQNGIIAKVLVGVRRCFA